MWYGIALYPDKVGDYVRRSQWHECSGREFLEELVRHLGFDDDVERILDSSTVVVNMMPFGVSQFLKRKVSLTDLMLFRKARPTWPSPVSSSKCRKIVVFTVEYSVRSAQIAVFTLLNLDKKPTPMRRPQRDLHVVWNAFKTLQG